MNASRLTPAKIRTFRNTVWNYHKAHGRHTLAWRKTRDPYSILVSEIMLQQTQVERVIPYFTAWLTAFPDVYALARSPLGKVLRLWQGLGYNRRAKMLYETAKVVAREYDGVFPKTPKDLETLPGVGPYTAGAVSAFAYNQDVIFIETNIRTVITYHFFTDVAHVDDRDIICVLERTLPNGRAREWYGALMDYGAHLKRSGVRINARAKGYTKQTKFAGSAREARGALLKELARGPKETASLLALLPKRRVQLRTALGKLTKEGFIILKRGKFQLP